MICYSMCWKTEICTVTLLIKLQNEVTHCYCCNDKGLWPDESENCITVI